MKSLLVIVLMILYRCGFCACLLYADPLIKRDFPRGIDDLERLALIKNYQLVYQEIKGKTAPMSDYLLYKKTLEPKGFYPPCTVEISLKRTIKAMFNPQEDDVLFKNKGTRSIPRVTRSGETRCTYALKDALFGMPQCEKNHSIK